MGDPRVRYDYRAWSVLMASPTGGVLYVRPELGVRGPADLAKLQAAQGLKFGSQGPTSLDVVPTLAFELMNLNVQIVFGMQGRGPGRLAFERGETPIDYQTSSAYTSQVLPLVREGKAPKIEQDHTQADYKGWCKAEDCLIDWAKPAQTVYNLIRGANPSPGASTLFKGESLTLFDARPVAPLGGKAGTISAVQDDGFIVEAEGGAILVQRLRYGKGPKEAAMEWFNREGLAVGTGFGS
jgi:hypothetical protein